MRTLLLILAILFAVDVPTQPPLPLRAQETPENASEFRFLAMDVFLDSACEALAAYQLELTGDPKIIKIVGVEGGEHPEFRNPPYYDPDGIQHERLILAAFTTAKSNELPHRRTRVLTVHLQVSGSEPPKLESILKLAANPNGEVIPAQITLLEKP